MLKLLGKRLKPYTLSISIAAVLLFMQALCSLYLPDLMSNIVNVGIQRAGIEHAAPQAISENGFKLLTAFMSEQERETARSSYELIDENSNADALADAKENYSKFAPGPFDAQNPTAVTAVYVLKDLPKDEQTTLNEAFGNGTYTFFMFVQDAMAQRAAANGAQAPAAQDEEQAKTPELDVKQVYALMPAIAALPQETINGYRAQALAVDATMRESVSATISKSFYDEVGADINSIQMGYLYKTGLSMLLVTLFQMVCMIFVSLLSSRTGAMFSRSLRSEVFGKVSGFSINEMNRFSTSSLITRTTNDIFAMQMVIIMGLRVVMNVPIMGIGGAVMALRKSSSMAWLIALAAVTMVGLVAVVFSLAVPRFKIMQTLVDKLTLVTRESLSGTLVVRAFNTQQFEEQRFDNANKALTKNSLFINRLMSTLFPVMQFMLNILMLLIVWVGANKVAASNMQIGDMMAFMQYAMMIMMSFFMLSMMFVMLPQAAVSAKRIMEVLDTEASVKDEQGAIERAVNPKGLLEFKKVGFSYPDAEATVLQDISFVAKPGTTTAFIGSTGSGKSTIVNLIPRFFDVTSGEILIDGINIKKYTQHALHELISLVPQRGQLLSGTIESNLLYGDPNAPRERLDKSAAIAQAADFIAAKEEGYDAPIAQGGANVSGGQRQRLAIARALTKNCPIYVFDDSFSALDFRTDLALRKALAAEMQDRTLIIVAQRISTIMNADEIIVLDEGKIAGIGKHADLLKTCEAYKEIAFSQLSKEELENEQQ